jgi:hypothetical protein
MGGGALRINLGRPITDLIAPMKRIAMHALELVSMSHGLAFRYSDLERVTCHAVIVLESNSVTAKTRKSEWSRANSVHSARLHNMTCNAKRGQMVIQFEISRNTLSNLFQQTLEMQQKVRN